MVLLKDAAIAARKSGLKVVEVPGWQTRGRPSSSGGFGPLRAIIVHHTGGSSNGQSMIDLLVRGRSDLPGPLCQFGLSREGVVYVIAAGRSNHGGKTKKIGNLRAGDGNSQALGIEAFNSGNEGWSKKQLSAYHALCAALADHYKIPRSQVFGHGETSLTGKWDPGVRGRMLDMAAFRRGVAAVKLPGGSAKFYDARDFPSATRPKHGVRGDHVIWLKKRLKVHGYSGFVLKSKTYGKGTISAVKAFQKDQGWVGGDADGYVGPTTLKLLAKSPKPPASKLLRSGHASMQFSDSPTQRKSDAKKIFDRALAKDLHWITGTEAFEKSTRDALRSEANRAGYVFYRNAAQDSWVAVKRSIIKKGSFKRHYSRAINGTKGHNTAKGAFGVSFDSTFGFKIAVLAGHLLTKGRPDAADPAYKVNIDKNRRIMKSYGTLAKSLKNSGAVVFYGGDQNILASKDPFLGQPFVNAWKELKKYPKTHAAGCIDMMAYWSDSRVSWVGARAFSDRTAMGLNTDHFYTEYTAQVK